MVSHAEIVQDGETEFYIEYLVQSNLKDVFDYYVDALDDEWEIDQQMFVDGDGGQIIAYFEDAYGLTLAVEYEAEALNVVRIHVYATHYQIDQ